MEHLRPVYEAGMLVGGWLFVVLVAFLVVTLIVAVFQEGRNRKPRRPLTSIFGGK